MLAADGSGNPDNLLAGTIARTDFRPPNLVITVPRNYLSLDPNDIFNLGVLRRNHAMHHRFSARQLTPLSRLPFALASRNYTQLDRTLTRLSYAIIRALSLKSRALVCTAITRKSLLARKVPTVKRWFYLGGR